MQNIMINELFGDDIEKAISLAWSVFCEFEAPDYSDEGIEEFKKSIHDLKYLSQLRIFGAFIDGDQVGVIATCSGGNHIALFFVDGKYQRNGIGKMLFMEVVRRCNSDRMTVNSSPFAVPVYHKLGFRDTDCEQVVSGVRFTPMEFMIEDNRQRN